MPNAPQCRLLLAIFVLSPFVAPAVVPGADSSGEQQPAFAATSLGDYIERAAAANPELLAFEERYRAAMERVPQAGSLPDPRLQITSFVESIQTRTGTQEHAIMLSQTVPWFGKLSRRESAASAEAEALWYAFQARQLAMARAVANAYFEYAYLARATAQTDDTLQLLRRLEASVEERVRGGADMNPLLRLQVEIGRVADRLRSLEQTRIGQSARLSALLALDSIKPLPWPEWETPEPADLDANDLLAALEGANPELATLDRKIASAEARRELARLESLPEFTLGVNYIQLDAYPNPAMPVADAGRDPWGVMVGINLPIWGGRNRAMREEARLAASAAAHERRDRENMLEAELVATVANLDDANRRLILYRDELLPVARQAVDITQSSYEGGRATILEVIDSERSLLELELQFWRAAADAWQHLVGIQVLTNQPIAGTFSPAPKP